ncbi:YqaE/Pmp3 family membrane protein [Flexibacterium corallicola]|uniref:YqaE/Pmp3 family membrane protein n=1 Tax=Flexibacterium corallicola TaxID=3037259 RepID=UPI00286F63EE|nr:YqaE/Pmp3 family membrane protein [Pseudovibrio sp. M1P-2-3]
MFGVYLMRLILAILLPFVVFFTIKRPIQGIFCFILQITILGWIPAAIWAVYALSQYNTDKKLLEMQHLDKQ